MLIIERRIFIVLGKKMTALEKAIAFQNGMTVSQIEGLAERRKKFDQRDFGDAEGLR